MCKEGNWKISIYQSEEHLTAQEPVLGYFSNLMKPEYYRLNLKHSMSDQNLNAARLKG